MADDNIDFRFLGKQVQKLQADVRDLRSDHIHLESEVAGLRADMSRVEERLDGVETQLEGLKGELSSLNQKIENHHLANQAQFQTQAQQMATNMQILLAAIGREHGS